MKKILWLLFGIVTLNSPFFMEVNAQMEVPPHRGNPEKILCVQKNSSITINIHYEFRLSDMQTHDEQKKLEYKLFIDDDGYITLPPFFRSIEGALSEIKNWKLLKNSSIDSIISNLTPSEKNRIALGFNNEDYGYRIKILKDKTCGKNCITYAELEKKLTDEYRKRIGGNRLQLSFINVTITPEEFLHTITVIYKGNSFQLPYSNLSVDDYFAQGYIQRQVGYGKRKLKVEVFSLCRKGDKDEDLENKTTFKLGHPLKNPIKLKEGDTIYLENNCLF